MTVAGTPNLNVANSPTVTIAGTPSVKPVEVPFEQVLSASSPQGSAACADITPPAGSTLAIQHASVELSGTRKPPAYILVKLTSPNADIFLRSERPDLQPTGDGRLTGTLDT